MEEFSDRHTEAIRYLAKANTDLAEAIQAATNKQFATAYSKTLRVKESIRLILEVQNDLTPEDRDSTE